MLDFVFAMIAAGLNSSASPQEGATAQAAVTAPQTPSIQSEDTPSVSVAQGSVVIGQNTVIAGTPAPQPAVPAGGGAAGPFNMSVVPAGLVAEPQTPSGKFTTAAEVKPILEATKGNWVAVRDYDGKDWLYVTHLWGWRCGLKALAISVNDETMQNWPLPPCHEQFTTPNAVLEDDGLPVLTFRQGSVQTITIQIVYDDLSMDVARFERGNVLIP